MPVHDDEREVPGDELYQDFLQLIAGYTYTFFVSTDRSKMSLLDATQVTSSCLYIQTDSSGW